MKKNILIGITLGLFLLNNNKSRNLSDATKLGWGTIYNNENPYPGKVKKDDDEEEDPYINGDAEGMAKHISLEGPKTEFIK